MKSVPRILITPEAVDVLQQLRGRFGELMFHQSGGCCDGSQPMCFEKGEFKVGSNDVYLGDIDGCGFFMSRDQFEYWQHTQLSVDITPGRGSSFSLEIPLGLRFIIRSRLFNDNELKHLSPVISGEEYLDKQADG
ncbi:DUF779 domain-containing protein [Mucilaginibacter sp.]|uniref:DUF779 domain-containing protein n=1 Tax=Mucilaginibacter sp. TaxID=1882438 RepID=UPI002C8A7827|nr:DUF779 domain-containing protein [Mucilaginibacter sp.]HTI59870.1 DUF779 domain-containing protein [Mucilaginibacter sp.]